MNRRLAAAGLASLVILGTAACKDDSPSEDSVKGTVTWKYPIGSVDELQVTDHSGVPHTVVVPGGAYTACYIGAQYPDCAGF